MTEVIQKLEELFIRFNTSPKLYQKRDYLELLRFLRLIANKIDAFLQDINNRIDQIVDDRLSETDFQIYVDKAIENKEFNIFAGVVNPDGGMKLNITVDENGNATFVQL